MMRFICVHGHFYQPPRENPWLEAVELQDSAYPYHDWNERITAESYAPNSVSRILNDEKQIIDIVNNYAKISFNFGPTLLTWMATQEPEVYRAVLDADTKSREQFGGHGSALAQCYNHSIMPLSNKQDKQTQVKWGVVDFEYRFGRKPEGMWLPETAVDADSLECLAAAGIRFTILAPRQAKRVRPLTGRKWQDVSEGRIDPRKPYLCRLPSGKTMTLFFYDGPVSRGIAFEQLLSSGEVFAQRLRSIFAATDEPQLVHIATDGETYGHHHLKGDMALAYAVNTIEKDQNEQLTVYGEYLEKFPPRDEVEIFENSSWSCIHGVERWRGNCGCNSGMHAGWHQEWRLPLRGALDWLRDNVIHIYNDQMAPHVRDPWGCRDAYIEVVLDRSEANVKRFLQQHASHSLEPADEIRVLQLLEMQRHAMQMYTSCGWFFDEISGIETVQILQYAARVIQLAQQLSHIELEKTFISLLERAPSNIAGYENGGEVYRKFVQPTVLDMIRVAAHYAVSSLFEDYAQETDIYAYKVKNLTYDRFESGKQKMTVGRSRIRARITWEEADVSFAVLHLGDHNLIGGVRGFIDERVFAQMHGELREAFKKNDIPQCIRLIEEHFENSQYSLWHLFKDEQKKILYQILDSTLEEVDISLRQINQHHYPIIQVIKQLGIPLPKVLAHTVLLMVNQDLLQVVGQPEPDFKRLSEIVSEVREWSLEIDKDTLGFLVRRRMNEWMKALHKAPYDVGLVTRAEQLVRLLKPLGLNLDLWEAQNYYFSVVKRVYVDMQQAAKEGDAAAADWIEHMHRLGQLLEVKVA